MKWRIKQEIQKYWELLAIPFSVSALIIAANAAGAFQYLEWLILDSYFLLRPAEPDDQRILIVTISEEDLAAIGTWPIPDGALATVISHLKHHRPSAIGLDIYRNLPVDPGYEQLVDVFESTPNLIGVEKVVGETVAPPHSLNPAEQVGLSDLVVDKDGQVRRALLSLNTDNQQLKYGLATKLALIYLARESIFPEVDSNDLGMIRLGSAVINRFQKYDGGYIRGDAGGYQTLINFRGPAAQFESISLSAILDNQFSPEQVENRVVLIGSTATSINDLFYTPLSREQESPGVFIHAQIVSQILAAALDGRPLIKVFAEPTEYLWIFVWSSLGAGITYILQQRKTINRKFRIIELFIETGALGGGILISSFCLFLVGWWIPTGGAVIALLATNVSMLVVHNQQLQSLAISDGLTKVANRRYFDQYLAQTVQQKKGLALIICDVDYFKRYNDTYGHQAGDVCLQAVAQAIRAVLRSSDIVARYGGEEFALVLPSANSEIALDIIHRVQRRIDRLQITHSGSEISDYITLSYGVSDISAEQTMSASELIHQADQALYCAKQAGRNQAKVAMAG
ncbi:MAG: CHASE2 domain-containing protein [Cyanobacteria bacterium P01_D01_bin.44]